MAAEREEPTWELFGSASGELTQRVADSGFEPDLVLSIPCGGENQVRALYYALQVLDA